MVKLTDINCSLEKKKHFQLFVFFNESVKELLSQKVYILKTNVILP